DHFAHGGGRRIAAPDYRNAQPATPRATLPGKDARLESDQAHTEGGQDQANDHHFKVQHLVAGDLDRYVNQEQHGGHRAAREDHLTCLFEPGVAPHAAVQSVDLVAGQRGGERDEHEEREVPAVLIGGDVAPVEDFGRAVTGDDTDRVEYHEKELCAHAAGQDGDAAGKRYRRVGPTGTVSVEL